jgi:hypothetical protein
MPLSATVDALVRWVWTLRFTLRPTSSNAKTYPLAHVRSRARYLSFGILCTLPEFKCSIMTGVELVYYPLTRSIVTTGNRQGRGVQCQVDSPPALAQTAPLHIPSRPERPSFGRIFDRRLRLYSARNCGKARANQSSDSSHTRFYSYPQ